MNTALIIIDMQMLMQERIDSHAVLGFDLPSTNLSARAIFDVTIGRLEADFAEVVDSRTVLAS